MMSVTARRTTFEGLSRLSLRFMGFGAMVVLFGLMSGCPQGTREKQAQEDVGKKPAVPVTAVEAVERSVPMRLSAVGSVKPVATAHVQAQVTGVIASAHVKEGAFVRKGDLLFSIDHRPFEAKLRHAQADLARDRAQLTSLRKQVENSAFMVKKGFLAKAQYNEIAARADALEATVKADEAAVESARLELMYCSIRSPIEGHAGELGADEGNVVKANESGNPLVVINQTNPIHVSFSLPERSLVLLRSQIPLNRLEIVAVVPGDEDHPVSGELAFMDNKVDSATGSITLKGVFPNEKGTLWPGQTVQVFLKLPAQAGAVVIPREAVQTGQDGPYVTIVKPDLTVEHRPVVLEKTADNEALVTRGIHAGDKVVTSGHAGLASGSLVMVVPDTPR